MMTSKELIRILNNIIFSFKTVYMWGVFGSPVTGALIATKAKQYPGFYTPAKQALLRSYIGKGYFGFDCVNVIKAVLWGWTGDATKAFGGAIYASNGVPDISADMMCTRLKRLSTNFSNIMPGEAVWVRGHIGIYIGDGKVIEATPSWKNGVQITACLNIGPIPGLKGRKWTSHGELPYISYEEPIAKPILKAPSKQTLVVDNELLDAVKKLQTKKLISMPSVWEHTSKINLQNVPLLLKNMGGIDRLYKDKIISDKLLWTSKTYTVDHVRSLIIKYSLLG